jgi:osmoprotectant transport system permease protein
MQRHYDLPHRNVRGLDHDLAYRGIASGSLQVTDLSTMDAEIAYYRLQALEDDLNHFPGYNAVAGRCRRPRCAPAIPGHPQRG